MQLVSNRFIETPYLVIDFGTTQLRILLLESAPPDAADKKIPRKASLLKVINFPDFTLQITADERAGMAKATYEGKLEEFRNKFINKQLTEILFENQVTIKTVVTFLSGSQISVKYLEVKKVKPEDQDAAITREAFKQMPFAIENERHAYRILGEKTNKEGQVLCKIQFIIMPELVIKKKLALLKSLDLKAEALLPLASVLEEASQTHLLPEGGLTEENKLPENCFRVVVVHIGYSSSYLMIYENGEFVFQRDILTGANSINEEVKKKAEEEGMTTLTHDDIENFKREIGVLPEDFIDDITGERAEEKKFVAQKTFEVAEKILSNIQISITYHLSTLGLPEDLDFVPVKKILLAGGGGNLKNFTDFIEGSTEIPTEVIDPVGDIFDPGTPDFDLEKNRAGLISVAGGSGFDWTPNFMDFWEVVSPRKKFSGGAAAGAIGEKLAQLKAFILEKMGKKPGSGDEEGKKAESVSFSRSEWTEKDVQNVYSGFAGVVALLMLGRYGLARMTWKNHVAEEKKLKSEVFKAKQKNTKYINLKTAVEAAKSKIQSRNQFKNLPLPWSQVLYEFGRLHLENTFVKSIQFFEKKTGEVSVLNFKMNVQAKDTDSLYSYIDSLNGSKYFSSVNFPEGSGYSTLNISKDKAVVQEVIQADLSGNITEKLRAENLIFTSQISELKKKLTEPHSPPSPEKKPNPSGPSGPSDQGGL